MKFTKEEISLCKQVAEKYRKDIGYGDWTLNEGGFVKVWPYRHNCKRIDVIPLWTISDCLEFLEENVNQVDVGQVKGEKPYCYIYDGLKGIEERFEGETKLEACLKAVLEEGK